MITKHAWTNQSDTGNTQGSFKMKRRGFIGSALAALSFGRVARGAESPHDPFILLLQGIYQPVDPGSGPASNLGLTSVNLNDGSYAVTKIYPVFGIPGDPTVSIGNFYVQLAGNLCAYDLPGGAIAMQFVNGAGAAVQRNFGYATIVSDRAGGFYLKGTFDLTIPEATGVYFSFAGGHNHMVASTHQLADSTLDEYCFCHISGKGK
jgi:hypothetical protein